MEEFAQLFEGSDLAHGHSKLTGEITDKGKQEAKSWLDKGQPSKKDWEAHINGEMTIGLSPINSKSMVKWGAIDVDSYNLDLVELNTRIVESKLPVVLCRSKSGGPHIYLFCSEWVPAPNMISVLETIASHLGFGTSEIFPKQASITHSDTVTDWGNWINLPYFDGDQSLRYALDEKNEALQTVADFIQYAKNKSVPKKEINSFKIEEKDELFAEGPPCLNRIWESETQDFRNISLANAAVYLKLAFPETWKEQLDIYNRKLKEPLGSSEVETLKQSYEKKEYRYQCDKEPLCRFCNASLCRKRRFGVGGKGALPVHRSLTKINTIPPIWCLDVQTNDGGTRRITMETDDLQNPARYQKRCMDTLDEVPPLLKKDDWDRVLRTLFRHVNYVDVPYEMSPEGQFVEILTDFLQDSVSNECDRTIEDLIRGLPYQDTQGYYFRMKDLMKHLKAQQFTELKRNQINAVIKEKLKAWKEFKHLCNRGVNYWIIPNESIDNPSGETTQSIPEVEKPDPY